MQYQQHPLPPVDRATPVLGFQLKEFDRLFEPICRLYADVVGSKKVTELLADPEALRREMGDVIRSLEDDGRAEMRMGSEFSSQSKLKFVQHGRSWGEGGEESVITAYFNPNHPRSDEVDRVKELKESFQSRLEDLLLKHGVAAVISDDLFRRAPTWRDIISEDNPGIMLEFDDSLSMPEVDLIVLS